MTIKQKFNLIDQTKLDNSQKTILVQIKEKTNNFTTKDKEVITKIDSALDKIISSLKEKMPDAIKTVKAKKSTTSTAAPQTVKKTKRTAMGLAKEIRKPGESWKESLERARKQMKEDSESATKTMKSEIQKLKDFIKNHKELKGISNTDLLRDAVRKAKPKGRRVSKNGNVYYEYRDNRTDRLAPNYPSGAPKLENGGDFMSGAYAEKGLEVNDLNSLIKQGYRFHGGDAFETYKEVKDILDDIKSDNFDYVIVKVNGKYPYYTIGQKAKETTYMRNKDGIKVKSVAMPEKKLSEAEWMAKHNDSPESRTYAVGGGIFLDTFTGETGTHYTGLVGETNAMSSGEMFEDGGEFSDNQRMIMNQNVELEHHHEELENILQDKTPVPAWVVAKMATASDNISDITHYLEGEKKYGNSNKKQTMNKKSIYEDGGNLDYWEDYQNDSPKLTKANLSSVEDEVNERIEDWNDNNEMGIENEVSARGAKKVLQLAEEFFKAKGYISADIIDAMISQESYMDGGFMNNVYANGGGVGELKVGDKIGFLRENGKYQYAEILSIEGENINLVVRHPSRKQWDNYFTETKERVNKFINTLSPDYNQKYLIKIKKFANGGFMDGVYAEDGAMIQNQQLINNATMNTAKMFANEGIPAYVPVYRRGGKIKKYAVGGGVFADTFTGYTGTHYTGLVGETNAMSSGEMFENGGGVGDYIYNKGTLKIKLNKIDKKEKFAEFEVYSGKTKFYMSVFDDGGIGGDMPERLWDTKVEEKINEVLEDFATKNFANGGGVGLKGNQKRIDMNHNGKLDSEDFRILRNSKKRYADGGMMDNMAVHDGTSFMNTPVYKRGGAIKNQYAGRTPEDVWNNLNTKQKLHFVYDHFTHDSNELKESLKQIGYKWKYLSNPLKDEFIFHIKEGQYADGGFMDGVYKKGGKVTFEEKSNAIAKQFEGKQVEPKYKRMYGKKYSRGEAKEVGNKIAGKMKAMYDKKAFGGLFGKKATTPSIDLDDKQVRLNTGEYVQVIDQTGDSLLVMELGKIGTGAEPKRVKISDVDMNSFMAGGKVKKRTTTTKTNSTDKRGGAMQLAKKIRKEGEKWQEALKRARLQLKK
jgi:hypothetical protein